MNKVLIMMTEAGGGHRASAESLRDVFQEQYGSQIQVDIVDMWTKHTPPLISGLPKAYGYLVTEMPWFYQWLFHSTQKPAVTRSMMDTLYPYVRRPVSRAIRFYAPDLIISVHPLMQDVPLRILSRSQMNVPFVTVITDWITIHPGWLHPDVTLCFVPNEEVYQKALEAGLSPEQVRFYGLPIRPAFAAPPQPKEALRQRLGMHTDLPAALVVGGGEGFGPVAQIARALSDSLAAAGRPAGQLVIVCGRNHKLQEELDAEEWPVPTLIKGFVENMPEWMAASDCIVTKAGPGTIAEALAAGLPMVLSGYIAGQEEGNAPYVVNNDVGIYSEDPFEIADTVSRWFGPERAAMSRMAEKAMLLGRPQSTYQIVGEIVGLLRDSPPAARRWAREPKRARRSRPRWG